MSEEGWETHRLLVMDRLSTLHDDLSAARADIHHLRNDLARLHGDVTKLKVKVAVWSACIATVGSALFNEIFHKVIR